MAHPCPTPASTSFTPETPVVSFKRESFYQSANTVSDDRPDDFSCDLPRGHSGAESTTPEEKMTTKATSTTIIVSLTCALGAMSFGADQGGSGQAVSRFI